MTPQLGIGNSLSAEPVSTLILRNTYSVSFDGTNDYVDTGFQPNFIHTNATMSYWCKLDNVSGNRAIGCHNSKRFYLGISGGTAYFGVANAYKYAVDISSHIAADTWMHLAVVAEDGTATYYLDGVSRDTFSYTQSASTNPNTNFFIGALSTSSSPNSYIDGLVDEVAIFDSALSASQIKSIYNGGYPQSLASYNPVGWWRMGDNDGGTGSTITDQGSGGNNGTLTNGPVFSTVTP